MTHKQVASPKLWSLPQRQTVPAEDVVPDFDLGVWATDGTDKPDK